MEPWIDKEGCDSTFLRRKTMNSWGIKGGHLVHKQDALAVLTFKLVQKQGYLATRNEHCSSPLSSSDSHVVTWGPGTEETLTPCEAQHTARCTNRRRRLCDPPRENLTPGLCGPRHSFWPFSKLFLFGHLEKLSKWNLLSPWESARHTVPKQALSLSQFLGSSALLTFLPRKCSSLKALHCTCPRAWTPSLWTTAQEGAMRAVWTPSHWTTAQEGAMRAVWTPSHWTTAQEGAMRAVWNTVRTQHLLNTAVFSS